MENKLTIIHTVLRRAIALPLAAALALAGTLASGDDVTENFDTSPANWTASTMHNGASIGWSNTGNASGSAGFNAFGMASGGMSTTEALAGKFYFDSVTYSIPEPGAALLGGLGLLALLRRRR